MRDPKLQALSVAELVELFAALGVEQDRTEQASAIGDIGKINRLFEQMEAVKEELKSRPGDQRRALLTLYDHPNMQVRLKAAKGTLAVAPEVARKLLEAIAQSRWQPQAGDAGMCLWALEEGVFIPE